MRFPWEEIERRCEREGGREEWGGAHAIKATLASDNMAMGIEEIRPVGAGHGHALKQEEEKEEEEGLISEGSGRLRRQ